MATYDPSRARRLGLFAAVWTLVLLAAYHLQFWFAQFAANPLDQDFTFYYLGAKLGLSGWHHLYDVGLQQHAYAELRPGAPFDILSRYTNPPPLAWLVVPLTALPVVPAYLVWACLNTAALVVAWRLAALGVGRERWLFLLGLLAWTAVVSALRLGQPAPIVLLGVTACWWFLERGRPVWAGVALSLVVVKPQLAILVGPALLVAGHWRVFAAWAACSGVLALVSLLLIGGEGVGDWWGILSVIAQIDFNRQLTLAYVLGGGWAGAAAQAAAVVATLAIAWWRRGGPSELPVMAGVLGSAVAATYWHLDDFTVLVIAFWLFVRLRPPPSLLVWPLALAVGVELYNGLGPAAGPVIVACEVGWLAGMARLAAVLPRPLIRSAA